MLGLHGFFHENSDGLLDMEHDCNYLLSVAKNKDPNHKWLKTNWAFPWMDQVVSGYDLFRAQMKANAIINKKHYLETFKAKGYYPAGIEDKWMEDDLVKELIADYRLK